MGLNVTVGSVARTVVSSLSEIGAKQFIYPILLCSILEHQRISVMIDYPQAAINCQWIAAIILFSSDVLDIETERRCTYAIRHVLEDRDIATMEGEDLILED